MYLSRSLCAWVILGVYVLGILLHAAWPPFMKAANPESSWYKAWEKTIGESAWMVMTFTWPVLWPLCLGARLLWPLAVRMMVLPEKLGTWVRRRREAKAIPRAIVEKKEDRP